MLERTVLLVLLMLAQPQLPNRPQVIDPMVLAWQDCQRLPPHQRPYVRYCWISPSLEPELKDRQEWWQEINLMCWRLSREQVPPMLAPVDGSFCVFRLDIDALGWHGRREETWEKLVDPYMTYPLRPSDAKATEIDTGERVPAGKDEQGRQLYEREYDEQGRIRFKTKKVPTKPGETRIALAPWYDAAASKNLAEATQSRMPLVRGDWLFDQLSIDAERKVGYSAFLGVKDEKDFDALVGRLTAEQRKLFPKASREAAVKVKGKSPTHAWRRIDVEAAAGGPYWRTSDNREAVDDRDPARVLLDGFKYEGRESLGHLPNGLLAAGAFAGNFNFEKEVLKRDKADVKEGTRADVAPDFLASDGFAPDTDKRIHVGMSCWRCHVEGIRDMTGFVRTNTQPPNAIQFVKPEEQKAFTHLYFSDIEDAVTVSRTIHAKAILKATTMTGVDPQGKQVEVVKGLTMAQESALIGKKWRKYAHAEVDLNYAARDLGLTPGQTVTALKNIKVTTGQLDFELDNLISGNLPLTIRQWERLYPLAKTVSMGVAPQ